MKHPSLHLAALMLAASMAADAQAAIFTVGTGAGCTHGTIQSAINAAETSAGTDTIRLTRSLTYGPEAVSINTTQELTIEGGYATCASAADATNTVVSGAGGAQAPVFTIAAPTGGLIHLRRLTISGGDTAGAGLGGGIRFEGDGILDIADSSITQNTAGFGGGIYAKGTGSNAELVIGANVVISGNTARYDGGGVYSSQIETSMTAPGSILFNNKATGVSSGSYTGGYGGGLYIQASDLNSYAYIGTGGIGSLGAINGNQALYGGGVAIGGSHSSGSARYAELQLFTTDPTHRGKIAGNFASVAGGAIHAKSSSSAYTYAYANAWNAEITDNGAPNGAAVFLTGSSISNFLFDGQNSALPWPAGAVHCPVGADCGRITGNRAWDGSSTYTNGAILEGDSSAAYFGIGAASTVDFLPTGGVVIEGNRGGRLVDSPNWALFKNALIDGNQSGLELIRSKYLHAYDSTLAGNTLGASASVLSSSSGNVTLQRSILWQPGRTTLTRSGGTMAVDHVIASEINSIGGNFGGGGDCGGGVCSILTDPLFVDPAHGDYSLRAYSPAIDASPAIAGDDRDAYGNPRDQDLPYTWADNGVRDLGALERQSLQPIVLNGDFDFSDLRLWTWLAGGWDGTESAAGGSGSGSWKFSTSGLPYTDVNVGEQCVLLPGPGRYLLNGWGKGGGNTMASRDYAVLKWEYRRAGGADCSVGAADAGGELTLGSGTSWGHPAQPASIDATEADFAVSRPSIKLRLVARDGNSTNVGGSISAWFDGITIEVEQGDVIFRNGFE